jgi:hypothetical protein
MEEHTLEDNFTENFWKEEEITTGELKGRESESFDFGEEGNEEEERASAEPFFTVRMTSFCPPWRGRLSRTHPRVPTRVVPLFPPMTSATVVPLVQV